MPGGATFSLNSGAHGLLVLRRAPLGDPVIYEIRGYRVCLRSADAARVRVRVREST